MNRVKRTAVAGLIFCLFCVLASSWLGRALGENVAFLIEYEKTAPRLSALKTAISRLPAGIDIESLRHEAEKAKYDSARLSAEISEEMSRYGMVVMDVSVKQISGKEVNVAVKGVVSADGLYGFLNGISSTNRFFFVRKLEVSPRSSAAQIISRLDQIKKNPKQLQALKAELDDAVLKNFNVDMEAVVVTS